MPDGESPLHGFGRRGEDPTARFDRPVPRRPFGSFDDATQEIRVSRHAREGHARVRRPHEGHAREGRWRPSSSTLAVSASAVVLLVLLATLFMVLRPDPEPVAGPDLTSTPTASGSASATPSATATPTQGATQSPRPPRVTHTEVPIPTVKPPPAELPPPPPPPVASTGPSCPQWNQAGDASPATVRSVLADAGARQNWRSGVSEPKGWETGTPYPPITISADLMNAVAFTESTWRSTVIACDGGIGLMQIMPATAPWMNQRFNRSYDVNTVEGNANLGAMYLQWLTMYFGLYYFGSFDLGTVAPVGDGGANVRLGDVVIAAYNVGYGAVENLHGTADSADDTLHVPNQWYVDRVKGYVNSCPCDSM